MQVGIYINSVGRAMSQNRTLLLSLLRENFLYLYNAKSCYMFQILLIYMGPKYISY